MENENNFEPEVELSGESLITEMAFQLIMDSEETEEFSFDIHWVDVENAPSITHITKETILEFLKDEWTKVFVYQDKGRPKLVATNSISKETVLIHGLADHYLALIHMVSKATKNREKLKKKEKIKVLSHELVQQVNLALQTNRTGEVGIGEYRFRDYFGRPVNVQVDKYVNGARKRAESLEFAKSENVVTEMDELINFVNNKINEGKVDAVALVTEFHARFVKIHPFRDGNGRTARLLSNYLLLSLGQPMVTVPAEDKQNYLHALDFANVSNLKLASEEFPGFGDYVREKYYQVTRNAFKQLLGISQKKDVSDDEIFEFMEKLRVGERKYIFAKELFKKHQMKDKPDKVAKKILNSYGQRYLNEAKTKTTPNMTLCPEYLSPEEDEDGLF